MHTSNAAINSAIYKTNFKDALLSNLISKATDNAYKAVGSYSSINSNSLFKESGLGKIALHSAVGVLSTKVFANLRLDIDKNEVVLDASKAKDREALKRIYYSINKEILNEFDKNHFVDTSSVKTSSSNANFSQQRSNAITKQTILSSITANNLNVEVGNNTHLKGSLLAAGEYDKDNTFIDNHNLNLKTNTLSYENLSNTSYTKGTNFSIEANYAFKDAKTDNQAKADNKDLNSKITSASYLNQRNLSYTLSKNLATLGNGNIEIADKENSDDLDRLNRGTTKLTKDLVNTSISSNVDASIDARMFTADGREQIKQELDEVRQGIGKIALKALLGNEVYKNTEIIIENLKRIKETDPQRYNEIVTAINEYNKEHEVLKGSILPAAVLPIAPVVAEFLAEIGVISVATVAAYGTKKIGDKYLSNGIDIITENEIGLEYKNSYIPKPSNDELENDDFLPDLRREKPKTPVSGGGGLRPRWKDKDGNIFEWDSQHGEMEIYDKQGKHQGSYNPKTKEKKPPVKNRKVKK